MASVPDDERRSVEPSFADVMNGFTFDSDRASRRRRRARREKEPDPEPEYPEPEYHQPKYYEPEYHQPEPEYYEPDPLDAPADAYLAEPDDDLRYPAEQSTSAVVRPYAWTMGRTRSRYHLEIETLVSTSSWGREQLGLLPFEHRSVAELCMEARSVAEVAALLEVPLGVAKVLLGDMAGLELVAVHQTASRNGDAPELDLMERVLIGLRRL